MCPTRPNRCGFGRVVLMGAGNISDTNLVMISPFDWTFSKSRSFPRKLAGKKSRGNEVIHFYDGHETSLRLRASQKNHLGLFVCEV